jgi:glycosyltransferase involved in cell wall biosynthesis
VLSSTAASLPEVCGDAALYFDPLDAGALAQLMVRVASDRQERERLVHRGRERLRQYSWRRAGQAYLALVDDWMEGAGSDGPVRRRRAAFAESSTSF